MSSDVAELGCLGPLPACCWQAKPEKLNVKCHLNDPLQCSDSGSNNAVTHQFLRVGSRVFEHRVNGHVKYWPRKLTQRPGQTFGFFEASRSWLSRYQPRLWSHRRFDWGRSQLPPYSWSCWQHSAVYDGLSLPGCWPETTLNSSLRGPLPREANSNAVFQASEGDSLSS